MRFNLDFHPLVPIDLAEASAWYERKERGIGLRLEAEAKDLFRRLNDEALLYAIRFSDVRRANLRKFPHGVFYFVFRETVVVLGVLHGAQNTEEELRRRRGAYG